MTHLTDEIIAVGSVVVSVALIAVGHVTEGASLFTLVVGYTLGRQRKVNGELAKVINAAKK